MKLTPDTYHRMLNSDEQRLAMEMSNRGISEMERTMMGVLQKLYAMTGKESGRWNRKTKGEVRRILEGAV